MRRRRRRRSVLVIGGEKSMGDVLVRQMKLVSPHVEAVALKDTGHWVVEERPAQTLEALMTFL